MSVHRNSSISSIRNCITFALPPLAAYIFNQDENATPLRPRSNIREIQDDPVMLATTSLVQREKGDY